MQRKWPLIYEEKILPLVHETGILEMIWKMNTPEDKYNLIHTNKDDWFLALASEELQKEIIKIAVKDVNTDFVYYMLSNIPSLRDVLFEDMVLLDFLIDSILKEDGFEQLRKDILDMWFEAKYEEWIEDYDDVSFLDDIADVEFEENVDVYVIVRAYYYTNPNKYIKQISELPDNTSKKLLMLLLPGIY